MLSSLNVSGPILLLLALLLFFFALSHINMTYLSIGGGPSCTGTLNENLSLKITIVKLDVSIYLPWLYSALLGVQSRAV